MGVQTHKVSRGFPTEDDVANALYVLDAPQDLDVLLIDL
jgi:hypothetical protein